MQSPFDVKDGKGQFAMPFDYTRGQLYENDLVRNLKEKTRKELKKHERELNIFLKAPQVYKEVNFKTQGLHGNYRTVLTIFELQTRTSIN